MRSKWERTKSLMHSSWGRCPQIPMLWKNSRAQTEELQLGYFRCLSMCTMYCITGLLALQKYFYSIQELIVWQSSSEYSSCLLILGYNGNCSSSSILKCHKVRDKKLQTKLISQTSHRGTNLCVSLQMNLVWAFMSEVFTSDNYSVYYYYYFVSPLDLSVFYLHWNIWRTLKSCSRKRHPSLFLTIQKSAYLGWKCPHWLYGTSIMVSLVRRVFPPVESCKASEILAQTSCFWGHLLLCHCRHH